MTNYAVFLQGDNFQLSREGVIQLLGFFVTLRVEAESEPEAEKKAIQLVRSDSQLAEAFKENSPASPEIRVKVVHQLLPENKMKNTEFTFFKMEEE